MTKQDIYNKLISDGIHTDNIHVDIKSVNSRLIYAFISLYGREREYCKICESLSVFETSPSPMEFDKGEVKTGINILTPHKVANILYNENWNEQSIKNFLSEAGYIGLTYHNGDELMNLYDLAESLL